MRLLQRLFMMSTRSRFTNTRKLEIICHVRSGRSIRAVAQEYRINESTLRRWIQNEVRIRSAPAANISVHRGRQRMDSVFEQQIVQQVLSLRHQGLTVTTSDVVDIALSANPIFRNGNRATLRMWAIRCMNANGIVNRRATRVSQHIPEILQPLIERFLSDITRLNSTYQYSADMVVNVDQTALYHGMSRSRTLERRGARTVRVLENPAASVRSTAVLAVSLSGEKLNPLIVFKGRPQGSISRNILLNRINLPATIEYSVQENAWADERVMIEWIEKCFSPYLVDKSRRSLLILDTYKAHMTARFVSAVSALNCDIIYIPGGLTPILQPLDISVNKPIKDYIRDSYSRWARNVFDSETCLRRPTRDEIARFLEQAWERLSRDIIISGFNFAGIRL